MIHSQKKFDDATILEALSLPDQAPLYLQNSHHYYGLQSKLKIGGIHKNRTPFHYSFTLRAQVFLFCGKNKFYNPCPLLLW